MSVSQRLEAKSYGLIGSVEELRDLEERAAKGELDTGIHDYKVKIDADLEYDRGTSIDSESLNRLTPGSKANHSSNTVRTIIQVLDEGQQIGDSADIEEYLEANYGRIEDLEFFGPEEYDEVPVASRRSSSQGFNRACVLEH